MAQSYQFQALPFGLCTAPRVLTKLLKPVITFRRTRNIRLLIYLDDILIVGSDIKTLKEQTGQVLDLLQSLGFIINSEKSVVTPSPVMEFLGLLVDSRTMMFYLPSHKVTKTIELCNALLQNRTVSLCELAQLLGFLESTRPAVWLAPLHFRHLQYCLIQQLARNKGSYDGLVCPQLLAKGELQWWISNIRQVNGSLIYPPSCEMTITSDGSKLGWGTACGVQTTKSSWSSQERSLHINILELKAAFLAIQSFLKHKTNMSIKLRLDNTTAVSYINNKGGTHSPELMALTLELWTWCPSRDIYIQAQHLPGVQNCLADKESRTYIDSSDWKLQPQLMRKWRKWNGWCDRQQIDPISAGLNNVLTFLSEQFESNLQYRAVNVLRSAISSTHQWVDGKPIGQHPLFIPLLKGISNERPIGPRYTSLQRLQASK